MRTSGGGSDKRKGREDMPKAFHPGGEVTHLRSRNWMDNRKGEGEKKVSGYQKLQGWRVEIRRGIGLKEEH